MRGWYWRVVVVLAAATVSPDGSSAGMVEARAAAPRVVDATVDATGDEIARPLTTTPGDPARGREIVADRRVGLCLLCHAGPFPEEHFQGTLAPDLAGAGVRWTAAQLRLRIVDARRLNAETIMPSYHVVAEGSRIGAAWRGRPVLDAQQIEDVVAFLATLR